MYASGMLTPKVSSAGAMMTAEMMNEAVTGTASPRTDTARAAKMTVTTSSTVGLSPNMPAASTMTEARFRPSPVWVTTATMMPAAAQVATTGSTDLLPSASAVYSRRGVIRCRASRKDSRNCRAVA